MYVCIWVDKHEHLLDILYHIYTSLHVCMYVCMHVARHALGMYVCLYICTECAKGVLVSATRHEGLTSTPS